MSRFPVACIILCAAAGVAIGYGLSVWEPENAATKAAAVRWVGLLGDLFLRALKCIVLPLVFINVTLSTIDMLRMGSAGRVVKYTFVLYICTTMLAAVIGIVVVILFKGYFVETPLPQPPPALFRIECDPGQFVTKHPDGTLACASSTSTTSSGGGVGEKNSNSEFELVDLSGAFVSSAGASGPASDVSLSDTVYEGVFTKLVSQNIVADFASANFGSIIVFAVVFGTAVHRAAKKMKKEDDGQGVEQAGQAAEQAGQGEGGQVVALFRELDRALAAMVGWVLTATPAAVCSLVAGSVGKQEDLASALRNVGFLLAAALCGFALHFILAYVGLLALLVRGRGTQSPFAYLRRLVPAQVMAFATASSAATIPVTLRCALGAPAAGPGGTGAGGTRRRAAVSPIVGRFVIPLGSTVNMDGGGVYFSIATIFLAVTSGRGDQITAASYAMLVVIATVGSAGTAPVPSASLVLILTAYNTIFGTTGTPAAFSFILAIDWLLDRLRTALNVTGDAVVARIVSHLLEQEQEQEQEQEEREGEGESVAVPAQSKIATVVGLSAPGSAPVMLLP